MDYKIFFDDDIDIAIKARDEGKAEEFLNAFIGIMEYKPETGETPEGMENSWIFNFYRRRIDRAYEKHRHRAEVNRENGRHGGRPKKNNETT